MTALEIFKSFVNHKNNSSLFKSWASAHPGELQRWRTFSAAILNGDHPAPPAMTTSEGLSLVDVGKLALAQAAVGAGFGISNFGVGTFGEQP